ncbi:MAG: hypothetical protein JW797_09925 [Bradymonadales bacterium]|nr:hypothetical protein [Bradymonadales bacterium]
MIGFADALVSALRRLYGLEPAAVIERLELASYIKTALRESHVPDA